MPVIVDAFGGRGQITSYGLPCSAIGDFNVIRSEEEKSGGTPFRMDRNVRDFHKFIDDNALVDLKFKGAGFTWSDGPRGKGKGKRPFPVPRTKMSSSACGAERA